MRPFTILCTTILLASTAQVWRIHQEVTAIEQWRQAALEGSASAMQALRDTPMISPWERCAWALILAELDTGKQVDISSVPVCRQMIRAEGESLMLDYTSQLKDKITEKSKVTRFFN